mgnify:CR=1 FL=1
MASIFRYLHDILCEIFPKNAKIKTDLEVRKAVINAYCNVLLAEESVKILERNRAVLQKNLDETTKIFENGLTEEEIGLGSTRDEVVAAYGEPQQTEDGEAIYDIGIAFSYDGDIVSKMRVWEP